MTFAQYREKCGERWYGEALRDALHNWHEWEDMRDYLVDAIRQYLRNPFQRDLGDKFYNPDGTLTKFLWHCQEALQPDRSRLNPLLDFEEHYQKIFLKRGLIIYCGDILDGLKEAAEKQTTLFELEEHP